MAGGERGGDGGTRDGLAAAGVAAFVVVCCAGLPLLAALVGGVALGTLLGVGTGVLAALVLGGALAARLRHPRNGAVTATRRPSSFSRHKENRQ